MGRFFKRRISQTELFKLDFKYPYLSAFAKNSQRAGVKKIIAKKVWRVYDNSVHYGEVNNLF